MNFYAKSQSIGVLKTTRHKTLKQMASQFPVRQQRQGVSLCNVCIYR